MRPFVALLCGAALALLSGAALANDPGTLVPTDASTTTGTGTTTPSSQAVAVAPVGGGVPSTGVECDNRGIKGTCTLAYLCKPPYVFTPSSEGATGCEKEPTAVRCCTGTDASQPRAPPPPAPDANGNVVCSYQGVQGYCTPQDKCGSNQLWTKNTHGAQGCGHLKEERCCTSACPEGEAAKMQSYLDAAKATCTAPTDPKMMCEPGTCRTALVTVGRLFIGCKDQATEPLWTTVKDYITPIETLCAAHTPPCVYNGKEVLKIKGNNDVVYDVYKLLPEHLTDRSMFNHAPTSKDNTIEVGAACAFAKMHEAAKQEAIIKITSGFRTVARQVYFWNLYQAGTGNLAARPGTSNHGRGRAFDLNTDCGRQSGNSPPAACNSSPVYQWLAQNGERFGFARAVKSEPWHWEFFPDGATRAPYT